MDSTSPRYGEKASYYSAVCLETGGVEWMELQGNSNAGTSVAFLRQMKEKHPGPLNVIWDNAPAHRGETVREYLRTPGLGLRGCVTNSLSLRERVRVRAYPCLNRNEPGLFRPWSMDVFDLSHSL